MPWTLRIDKEQGVVFLKLNGAALIEEVSVGQTTLRDHPDFKPHFRALYDLQEATDFDLDASKLYRMSENNPFDGSGRRAFVANRTLVHGMMRIYTTLRDEDKDHIQIFDDMAEAKEWLGID